MNRIYLAGPISGFDYENASKWRNLIADELKDVAECFSPMRKCSDLKDKGIIKAEMEYTEVNPMGTSKSVMMRDFFDVKRADLLIVNFLEATAVSIGTVMEVAWAWQMHKPVIVMAMPDNKHITHLMMKEAISVVVPTLKEAAMVARAYLTTEI